MTLSETKARIRMARAIMDYLRHKVITTPPSLLPSFELPPDQFELLEWAMSCLVKTWVYDQYDEEGYPVWESRRWVRQNLLYTDLSSPRQPNLRFKGVPVFVRPQ